MLIPLYSQPLTLPEEVMATEEAFTDLAGHLLVCASSAVPMMLGACCDSTRRPSRLPDCSNVLPSVWSDYMLKLPGQKAPEHATDLSIETRTIHDHSMRARGHEVDFD